MPLAKYHFHPQLVVRTPVKSYEDKSRHWTEIIHDPHFQEAIGISSRDLYKEIKRLADQKEGDQSPAGQTKIQNAIVKYWSRMCSRTTPFGLFAAVGVADWSADENSVIVLSEKKINRRSRLDMSYLCQLAMRIEEDPEISCSLKFYPNSSIYLMGEDYRFLESEDLSSRKGYKITAVSYTSHLNAVLKQAEKGVTLIALLDLLCTDFNVHDNNAFLYISELVDSQVLVSELEPTVTGEEYCSQILAVLHRLRHIPTARRFYKSLLELNDLFAAMDKNVWNDQKIYSQVIDKSKALLKDADPTKLIQVDSFAHFNDSKVNIGIQNNLRHGIDALMKCQIPNENADLNRFVTKFNDRYEGQQVPLSEVLDPETGLGYPENSSSDLSTLGEGLDLFDEQSKSQVWNEFETWAFQKLVHSEKQGVYEYVITDEDLEQFPSYDHDLAPSIAVMFRVLNPKTGEVLLESAGGSSAINLLGRFGHGHEEIRHMMEDVAQSEERHNPEVIFAEIVHLPESRAGNILQRPAVRSYEIPYLAKSGVDNQYQVSIQDLYVKVENNKIQLWSHRLGKRVVPRLSTAHNFKLSDMPVYKFLCDLQTHELNSSLVFKWGSLTEKFKFFPRVKYQNAILSPATWRFLSEDFEELRLAKNQTDLRFLLAHLREEWKLPRDIVLAEGDNELLVDLSKLSELKILLDATKNRSNFIIKEVLGMKNPQVRDGENKGYTNQMLACLVKEEKSYEISHRNELRPAINSATVVRKFVPGSEWLYYKFYCGDRTSDTLLEQVIAPAVSALKSQRIVDQWFFIRFDDGHPHLRFRVHLTDAKHFGAVVTKISTLIKPFEDHKQVWKTEISSYEREIRRYGLDTIEEAEKMFYYDSEASLVIISREREAQTEEMRWKYLLKLMDDSLSGFGMDMEERLKFADRHKESFMIEFNVDKKAKRELDLKYRQFQQEIYQLLNSTEMGKEDFSDILASRHESCSKVAQKIIEKKKHESNDWRLMLVGSFIHMSINRVMMARQRFYEMILYYFLAKHYKSAVARSKKSSVVA